LRLDFVINLPGRKLIIDSKWPLTKYEEFIRTEDKDEQEKKLKELVSAFKNTIRDLAGRRYWEYLDDSTGFVLLYVPNDSFLSLVLSKDPGIFSYAVEKNIILVSPSSILPALVLIAEIIRYTKVMDEFEQVYRQIDNFMQLTDQFEAKAADLGKNLDKTVAAFNTLVGFWKKIKVDFDWKTLKDVALEQKQKKRNELNVLDSKTKKLD
jgi:DNA recombination protein RmuC